MTALQLNAELFRELNVIVTDESMMEKAIKALRRITERQVRSSRKQAAAPHIDIEALPELPVGLKQLRGMGHITQNDIEHDERLAYILSK